MILPSIVILSSVSLITFIGLILVGLPLLKKVPPREIAFAILCLTFELVAYLSYMVNYIFSSETSIDEQTVIFERIGYFFSIMAIMMITYVVIFVDFKYHYLDIIELVLFSWIGGVNATYNAITFKIELSNGIINSTYTSLGIIFVVFFFIIVVFVWLRRIIRIARIYRQQNKVQNLYRSLIVFIIVGLTFVTIYVSSVALYNYEGDNTFLMGGFFTLIGSIALYRNNAFLFITDVELDSIIIIEKKTGLRLYSKNFKIDTNDNDYDSDFIGSVISAINISFSNTIKSSKDLTELTFVDKTVLIYSGSTVRSIMIVSSTNLIAKGVSKYLANRFEKMFSDTITKDLLEEKFIGVEDDYWLFDSVVNYVRTFLPL